MFTMREGIVAGVSATLGLVAGLSIPTLRNNGMPSNQSPPTASITLVTDPATQERLGDGVLLLSDPRLSPQQLQKIGRQLVTRDPIDAVRRAKEIPGIENRDAYLGEALRAWGEADGETASRWVQSHLAGEALSDALYYVADGWAEAEPAKAAAWFHENTSGSIRDDALWESIEAWGRKDISAAVVWVKSLDEQLKWIAMDGLASGWASIDSPAAAAAGLQMLDEDYGHDFVITATNHWADSDPRSAAEWASGLENARLRANVSGELGKVWSQHDPKAAAAWLTTVADERSRRAALEGIAIGWSKHDPAGAIEWALASGDAPEALDEIITDITFNWSNLDPAGAAKWLENRPRGPDRDRVIQKFTTCFFEDDPQAAVGWAAEIGDPVQRETELRRLLKQWVDLRGEVARKEIETLDLPDGLKSEFAKATPN